MVNLLISVEELASIVANDDVRLADCRWYLEDPALGEAEFGRGHIPGAQYVSLDTDLSGTTGPGRHPLPSPDAFGSTMERLGITPETTVVVYDDKGGGIAARLWWMLTDQGHRNVAVLDGGIHAWVSGGHKLSGDDRTYPEGHFPTRPWDRVIYRDAVASRSADTTVIDARATERYRGEGDLVDPKAGHIPGAVSLPLTENLSEDGRFLSADALRRRFTEAGIDDPTKVISQCGSGVTACHNILALEIAGIGRPNLYVGSWSDWSTSDLPIAVGETP